MAFTAHDIVPDSPTNNFATLNSLSTRGATTSGTWAQDGNLKALSDTNASMVVFSTMSFLTRKYYTEFLVVNTVENNDHIGIAFDSVVNDTVSVTADGGTCVAYKASGQKIIDGSLSNYGNSYTDGNLIGVFVDLDNNEVTFYKEGISQGTITGVISGTYLYRVRFNNTTNQQSQCIVNFGQDPTFGGAKSPTTTYTDANGIGSFYYQPPTGALALCTANLPDFTPDVTGDVPQDYFKTVLYTGNGTGQSITGVGFQPDFVWLKGKSLASAGNIIDSIRGAEYRLRPDETSEESFQSPYGYVSGVTSDGFTLAEGSSTDPTYTGSYETNQSGQTYVAWCFRAGGNSNTFNINGTGYSTYSALQTANTSLPASSTSGMIVPSGMSINTDAGFSIVKYTGNSVAATNSGSPVDFIPHGLSSAPEFFVLKDTSRAGSWNVGISNIIDTNDRYLRLNESTSVYTNIIIRADSNVIQLDHYNVENSVEYICYAWHSVEGYSKFGSYTGNGSADGPFVYCGFRPAFVMVKLSDGASSWILNDSKRSPYNLVNKSLFADLSLNEDSADVLDFLSNGFKLKASVRNNVSNGTYIFMAFAEQPFKFSNAR
jgi:hypothetical protein